jgi:hypothetical protein
VRFGQIWHELHPGEVGADAIDARLHDERVHPATRGQRRHPLPTDPLPDGAFVAAGDTALVILGGALRRWTPSGYVEADAGATDRLELVTPPSLVDVLRRGWDPVVPLLHPSARTQPSG